MIAAGHKNKTFSLNMLFKGYIIYNSHCALSAIKIPSMEDNLQILKAGLIA
jgi:hypothetical protein